jgi:hypothetical protein
MSSLAPLFDNNFNMDVDPPCADQDYAPRSDVDPEPEQNQNSSPLGSQQAPDPLHITRIYHPTINGV